MSFPLVRSISRREALRQTFFYSAALALGSRTSALAQLPVPGQQPPLAAAALPGRDRHFLMIGDFGSLGQSSSSTLEPSVGGDPVDLTPSLITRITPTPKPSIPPQQQPVASAMQAYVQAQRIQAEGLFLLGDNFYGSMRGGVNSPRWKAGFEDMYPASVFPGPCWAMLGNHDYDEENGLKLAAELDYADARPGTRWTMPNKWYRVDWPAKDPLMTVLVLDSNYKNGYIYLTQEERSKQLKWLATELAKPRTAPWMVCMGHHPLYSNGPHGDHPNLIKDWGPLFEKYKVAFYFCGHDHDLQHLEFEGMSTSFVVSGGGGAALTRLKKPDRGLFSIAANGFTHLQVSRDRFTVRHIDPQQRRLHAFSKTAAGRVEMLA